MDKVALHAALPGTDVASPADFCKIKAGGPQGKIRLPEPLTTPNTRIHDLAGHLAQRGAEFPVGLELLFRIRFATAASLESYLPGGGGGGGGGGGCRRGYLHDVSLHYTTLLVHCFMSMPCFMLGVIAFSDVLLLALRITTPPF